MSETNTVSPLRQRMIEDMAARKLNPNTQRSHIYSCKRFAAWLKRSPDTATADEVRRFLPFVNIGGDTEQDYFVDGMTESLTTDLSRIGGAFVIARNSAIYYKGKSVDVRQVGRELNVRYALEGSVQRGGSRFRVNVQLIDTETGNHLWAERFDKPVADLFDVQDEIVSRLSNALTSQLVEVEAQRAERAPHPDATDLYFQGWAFANKGITPEYMTKARSFFERALTIDPKNIEALVGMASIDLGMAANHLIERRDHPSAKL